MSIELDHLYFSSKPKKRKRSCSVKGCSSNNLSIEDNEKYSSHALPTKVAMRHKWLQAIKCQKKIVSDYTYICSRHFLPQDFRPGSDRNLLKPTAIPSQNLPPKTPRELAAAAREKRFLERHKKKDITAQPLTNPVPIQNKPDPFIIKGLVNKFAVQINKNMVGPSEQIKSAELVKEKLTECFEGTLTSLIKTDRELKELTGLTSITQLDEIVIIVSFHEARNTNTFFLSVKDRIVLTLVKLKLMISFECLGNLFKVTSITANSYFRFMLPILSQIFSTAIYWPTDQQIIANRPSCFEEFEKVKVIVSYQEIKFEKSLCISCRLKTYCQVKGEHCVKYLLGISPSGLICHVSECYGGHMSEKQTFINSKIINFLTPYKDVVMLDKNFLRLDNYSTSFEAILKPFSLEVKVQSAESVSSETKKKKVKPKESRSAQLTNIHNHVQQTICKVQNFKVLTSELPCAFRRHINDIIKIIAGIVNISPRK